MAFGSKSLMKGLTACTVLQDVCHITCCWIIYWCTWYYV